MSDEVRHIYPFNFQTKGKQLAQDDEGFEIADYGNGPDMLDSDNEEDVKSGNNATSSRYDTPTSSKSQARLEMDPSSLTAQSEMKAQTTTRSSLEGETIFAVGDDVEDRWSDDEDATSHGSSDGRVAGRIVHK